MTTLAELYLQWLGDHFEDDAERVAACIGRLRGERGVGAAPGWWASPEAMSGVLPLPAAWRPRVLLALGLVLAALCCALVTGVGAGGGMGKLFELVAELIIVTSLVAACAVV